MGGWGAILIISGSLLPLLSTLETFEPTEGFCPCHTQDHQNTSTSANRVFVVANPNILAAGKAMLLLLFLSYPYTSSHNSTRSIFTTHSHSPLCSLTLPHFHCLHRLHPQRGFQSHGSLSLTSSHCFPLVHQFCTVLSAILCLTPCVYASSTWKTPP